MTKFATLSEKNGKSQETFYHFVQYTQNEKVLQYLKSVLDSVEMEICGHNSIFHLDLIHLVEEKSVDDFLSIDTINRCMLGSKIKGQLKPIEFEYSIDQEEIICEISETLCYGGLGCFVE